MIFARMRRVSILEQCEMLEFNVNLIITGGAGFIGSSLVDHWNSSFPLSNVLIVDNFNDFYPAQWKRNFIGSALSENFDKVELLEQDVAVEPEEVSRLIKAAIVRKWKALVADDWTVVHLAASAGVRPSTVRPFFYAKNNALGTMSILETARLLGIRKVINASSSSVYGRRSTVPFSEVDPIKSPQSPYAATKIAGELFCENYSILHRMMCVSLRFFTVYGPRQRPDLAIHQFSQKILRGDMIALYGDGTTARDYTYIDDILDGMTGAIKWLSRQAAVVTDGVHQAVNLGSHKPVDLKTMISVLESTLKRKANIRWESVPNEDVLITFADIEKASRLFQYAPKIAFDEGIARFCKWFSSWN